MARKLFHILSGTLIALLFVKVFPRPLGILWMLSSAAVLGVCDLLRLRWAWLNHLALRVMGPLMRETERENLSSQFYYVAGLSLAIVAFPKPIAVQAILTLAWMDPAAGSFGLRFGRTRWNRVFRTPVPIGDKTVEGSLAGALAAFLAGVVAWTGPWAACPGEVRMWWPEPEIVLLLSAIGAVVAMLAEAWPSQWDDNVNIPFWGGLAVWAAATFWGVPMRYF